MFVLLIARQTSFWGIVKYLSLLFEYFIVFPQESTSIVLLKHNKWGILPLMGYFDTWQPEREADVVKTEISSKQHFEAKNSLSLLFTQPTHSFGKRHY